MYGLLGAAGVVLCILLYFNDPSEPFTIFPPCPTHYITDLHCPGCGTLRAIHAILHGEFREAISQNILTVIFIPVIILMLVFPRKFNPPYLPLIVLVVFIIFTILRNLEAFSFLAPH